MNTSRHLAMFTLCVAVSSLISARARPPDPSEAEKAMAADRDNPHLLSRVGDARFLAGDEAAYQSYTLAWHYALKDAWDATKGDSPVWKVLAAGVAVLGVATDVVNAQQGVTSNFAVEAMDTSGKMMATLEEATGNKDVRKNVKRIMGDIKALTKRGESSYRIIYPMDSRVAGAGMARIYTANGICNGVRVDTGKYAVSTACLEKFGEPTGVTINTTLRPEDFASVTNVEADGGQSVVTVSTTEGDISTDSWRPSKPSGVQSASKPDAWGATWFAPEFDFIVPVFEACTSDHFDDCGDVYGNNAILWVRQGGEWRFYGFATPDGKIASDYVAALQ